MQEIVGCILKGTTAEYNSLPNKNNNTVWEGFMFWDLDTGNIYNNNGTGWSLISGPDRQETLKNKSIPADQNTFQNILQDPLVNNRREGIFVPSLSAETSVKFALGGMNYGGSYTYVYDQDIGRFSTSIIDTIGYFPTSSNKVISRIGWNTSLKVKIKPSDTNLTRQYIGFSNNLTPQFLDTPLANNESGVFVGYNTVLNDFTVWWNDGLGSPPTPLSLGLQKDNLFHIFTINMSPLTGISCILDNQTPINLVSRLPGNNADLVLSILLQNTTTRVNYLDIGKIRLSSNIS